jgi:hypothetical protein
VQEIQWGLLRTKLSQRNCSPLTLYNVVNPALFTAQNTYALLVGLVEGFPWEDTMIETVYCKECLYVSQIIFFLRPLPVDHCIGNVKSFLYESIFPYSSHSNCSYAGECCRSICVLRSSIRKVSLAKTYTYRDRASFETPNTLLRYLGFRLSSSCRYSHKGNK